MGLQEDYSPNFFIYFSSCLTGSAWKKGKNQVKVDFKHQFNIGAKLKDEQDKVAVHLVASAVAFKGSMNMLVEPEVAD